MLNAHYLPHDTMGKILCVLPLAHMHREALAGCNVHTGLQRNGRPTKRRAEWCTRAESLKQVFSRLIVLVARVRNNTRRWPRTMPILFGFILYFIGGSGRDSFRSGLAGASVWRVVATYLPPHTYI